MEPATTEWDANNFDRVLNLLEGRFSRALVRRAVARVLAAPPGAALQTHQAIIDLARDRDGKLHLVTTNFDLLFQAEAQFREIEIMTPERCDGHTLRQLRALGARFYVVAVDGSRQVGVGLCRKDVS